MSENKHYLTVSVRLVGNTPFGFAEPFRDVEWIDVSDACFFKIVLADNGVAYIAKNEVLALVVTKQK